MFWPRLRQEPHATAWRLWAGECPGDALKHVTKPLQPSYLQNWLLFLGPYILAIWLRTQEPTTWVVWLLGKLQQVSKLNVIYFPLYAETHLGLKCVAARYVPWCFMNRSGRSRKISYIPYVLTMTATSSTK